MAKVWTDERRAAYSRMMKARKAWAHSTGPRTAEGKKRASGNARGKGCRQRLDAELAPLEALMREWEVARRDQSTPLGTFASLFLSSKCPKN